MYILKFIKLHLIVRIFYNYKARCLLSSNSTLLYCSSYHKDTPVLLNILQWPLAIYLYMSITK